jgi:hypothetical protein
MVEPTTFQDLVMDMRGKTLGSLLLAGLVLIVIIAMETRKTGVAQDGCYAMSAPAEPTICR